MSQPNHRVRPAIALIIPFLLALVAQAPSAQVDVQWVEVSLTHAFTDNQPCPGQPLSLFVTVYADGMTGGTVDIPGVGVVPLVFDEEEGEGFITDLECFFPSPVPSTGPPLGTYTFVFDGPGISVTKSVLFDLPEPASKLPMVTSPVPGASGVGLQPTFAWNLTGTPSGNSRLNIEVSNQVINDDVAFGDPAITDVSWTSPIDLLPETSHVLDIEAFVEDYSWVVTQQGDGFTFAEHHEYENCVSFTTGSSSEPWIWYQEEGEGLYAGSESQAFDSFGSDVAVSGHTIVAGADDDDDDTGGYARVFRRNGHDWILEDIIGLDVRQPGDIFGSAVAIDGDTIAVGAASSDHNGTPGAAGTDDRGAVFVYTGVGGGWTMEQELHAATPQNFDEFGESVAICGDVIVVGAPYTDYGGVSNAGSVYVFTRTGTFWSEALRIDSPNPVVDGAFGEDVAVSGKWIAAGAIGENAPGGTAVGRAYVWDFDGAALGLAGGEFVGEGVGDEFGVSVSLSGGRLVIGAPNNDTAGLDAGAAYVETFTLPGGWAREQKLTASDASPGDLFGNDVAIAGDTVAVGANDRASGGFASAGGVYLFDRDTLVTPGLPGPWSEADLLTTPEPGDDDFGESVSLSADTLAIGAAETEGGGGPGVGRAWVFRLFQGRWIDNGLNLSGSLGDPVLVGDGPLTAGSSNSVGLSNALPNSTTNIILGLTSLYAGFKDGTMVPGPPWFFFTGLSVDGSGEYSLPFIWPAGIPAGTQFWVQHWITDSGGEGSSGFAASNGLLGKAQ